MPTTTTPAQPPGSDPFTPLPNEVSIPIDDSMHKFEFSRRWFRNRNQKTWSTLLAPQFGGGRRIEMLQIGVFEGADLVWCCQNLLQHPGSRALAIDPWDPTGKLDMATMVEAERRARWNLSPWQNKVEIVKAYSQEYLAALQKRRRFDLMVIDGCHDAGPVFQDAALSLALAKPGAWMVFDDVRNKNPKRNHVAEGIRRFLEIFGDRVKLLWEHRHCNAYEVLT